MKFSLRHKSQDDDFSSLDAGAVYSEGADIADTKAPTGRPDR